MKTTLSKPNRNINTQGSKLHVYFIFTREGKPAAS